jgi:hypothetical protein
MWRIRSSLSVVNWFLFLKNLTVCFFRRTRNRKSLVWKEVRTTSTDVFNLSFRHGRTSTQFILHFRGKNLRNARAWILLDKRKNIFRSRNCVAIMSIKLGLLFKTLLFCFLAKTRILQGIFQFFVLGKMEAFRMANVDPSHLIYQVHFPSHFIRLCEL